MSSAEATVVSRYREKVKKETRRREKEDRPLLMPLHWWHYVFHTSASLNLAQSTEWIDLILMVKVKVSVTPCPSRSWVNNRWREFDCIWCKRPLYFKVKLIRIWGLKVKVTMTSKNIHGHNSEMYVMNVWMNVCSEMYFWLNFTQMSNWINWWNDHLLHQNHERPTEAS